MSTDGDGVTVGRDGVGVVVCGTGCCVTIGLGAPEAHAAIVTAPRRIKRRPTPQLWTSELLSVNAGTRQQADRLKCAASTSNGSTGRTSSAIDSQDDDFP